MTYRVMCLTVLMRTPRVFEKEQRVEIYFR